MPCLMLVVLKMVIHSQVIIKLKCRDRKTATKKCKQKFNNDWLHEMKSIESSKSGPYLTGQF